MYLANNTHPALVLIDPKRNADSTWHSWMAWQVLGELILSALPPSPPIQINVQFPVGINVRDPAGSTPHMRLGCWYTLYVCVLSLPSHGQGDSL